MRAERIIPMIPAVMLLAALFPGAIRLTVREIRHANHILMGVLLKDVYRLLTRKISENRLGEVRTAILISYYQFLKRRYLDNYRKAHQ